MYPAAMCMCRITLSSASCPALQSFSTFSPKRHNIRKEFLDTKYMFWFFYKSVYNIFHSNKNWAIYVHICIWVFMSSTRYSSQSLMRLKFSRQISKNVFNTKFHKNQSDGNRIVLCWRTDGQRNHENNSTFLQFCEAL